MDVEVCIPWFGAQFLLVNQSALHGERNVSFEDKVVVGISVVVIDELPLCVLISLSDHWGHIDDLVNVESANKQVVEVVNGCGWWRSVHPSCESERSLRGMSVNSDPSRVTFAISSCLPMIALDLENALWWSCNGLCNVIKENCGTQGVIEVLESVRLASNNLVDDVKDNHQEIHWWSIIFPHKSLGIYECCVEGSKVNN